MSVLTIVQHGNTTVQKQLETIPAPTSYVLNMRLGLALRLLLVLTFSPTLQSHASDLALVGAKIYLSPSEPPIESGTILVHSGHILSVGPIAEIKVPRGTAVIDCKGLVVTAGFWSSHVNILFRADHVTTSTDAHAVGVYYRF